MKAIISLVWVVVALQLTACAAGPCDGRMTRINPSMVARRVRGAVNGHRNRGRNVGHVVRQDGTS